MRRLVITFAAIAALVGVAASAGAQTFSARRLGMGGVLVPHSGGSEEANVALRAVPRPARDEASLSLPIGLVGLLQDKPVLDPDDPEFNAWELANTLFNPPWNLQMGTPPAPSNDITVSIARDRLSVNLGDISNMFPSQTSTLGIQVGGPAFGFGVRGAFAEVAPLVHARNDLRMNDALHGVLADGADFTTRTNYQLTNAALGQAAAGVRLGWAGRVLGGESTDSTVSPAIYMGGRAKLLRGLGYGDADHVVSFQTGDTLFSDSPVAVDVDGRTRTAGPDGGGFGAGFDLGLVWAAPGLQLGVGVNDVSTALDWRVRESVVHRDSVTGEVHRTITAENVRWTSHVPAVVTAHLAWTGARHTVAADVVSDEIGTVAHVGLERWWGFLATRAGVRMDRERAVQWSGGLGVKMGRLGLDVAAATHTRNLMREEQSELAVGLGWYPREEK